MRAAVVARRKVVGGVTSERTFHARHYAIPAPLFKRSPPLHASAWQPSLACPAGARGSERRLVGLSRFELLTPRLSSVCSNQLSYRPLPRTCNRLVPVLSKLDRRAIHNPESQIDHRFFRSLFFRCAKETSEAKNSRKEVIQPQVLLQLPCYDFTPITDHTLGASLPFGLVWRLLVQPAFVM